MNRPMTPQFVLESVCDQMGVGIEEVLGRSKHAVVVSARSVAAMLAREHTTFSYPEIARSLGRSNHSTVVTATQRMRRLIAEGAECMVGRPPKMRPIAEVCAELSARVVADWAKQCEPPPAPPETPEQRRRTITRAVLGGRAELEAMLRLPVGQLAYLSVDAATDLLDLLLRRPEIVDVVRLVRLSAEVA